MVTCYVMLEIDSQTFELLHKVKEDTGLKDRMRM